jgi:hypothetical protein
VLAFQTGFNETQNPPLAGDADRNGRFDSADIVLVFRAGKYETGQRPRWEEGDWDSNGLFDSGDLVAALQAGRYEQPPAALQPVFTDDPMRRGRRHRGMLRTEDLDILFAEWIADDRLQSRGDGRGFSDLRGRLIR